MNNTVKNSNLKSGLMEFKHPVRDCLFSLSGSAKHDIHKVRQMEQCVCDVCEEPDKEKRQSSTMMLLIKY